MASYIFEEGYPGPKARHPMHDKPQLLINILDGMARVRPATLYGEFPRSWVNYSEGMRRVTHGQLANAVNGAAWWLIKKLGPGIDFQTLSFMGWNDIRYVIFILGAVKAGYKILLTSPQNSGEGTSNLFTAMKCRILLTTEPRPPTVSTVLHIQDLQVLAVPSIQELLDVSHEHFPYDKKFESAKMEPLVALHTSGTTGLPKPIIYTHDFAASFVRWLQLDPPEGFDSLEKLSQGNRAFILSPPFHCSAILVMIEAIAGQTAYVYPPAAKIPTAALIKEGLKHTNVVGVLGGPTLVAECANDPELLDFLAGRFSNMCYGGGDVSEVFGDIVSAKLNLYTSHGSTETGAYPLIRRRGDWDPKDWKYFQAHPAAGLQFRKYQDNLYEAFIVRNPESDNEQPVFKLFPDLQEYATNDLYSPHPTKLDMWMYESRSDDMINLSNGTLANPYIMENALLEFPGVENVVMVPVQAIGTEKYALTCALLVQLSSVEPLSIERKADFVEKLWPVVEKANKYYRTEAYISKFHILFVGPERPLPRSAKGTVQRNKILEIYAKELDSIS